MRAMTRISDDMHLVARGRRQSEGEVPRKSQKKRSKLCDKVEENGVWTDEYCGIGRWYPERTMCGDLVIQVPGSLCTYLGGGSQREVICNLCSHSIVGITIVGLVIGCHFLQLRPS